MIDDYDSITLGGINLIRPHQSMSARRQTIVRESYTQLPGTGYWYHHMDLDRLAKATLGRRWDGAIPMSDDHYWTLRENPGVWYYPSTGPGHLTGYFVSMELMLTILANIVSALEVNDGE
jgi:hypothetical protein